MFLISHRGNLSGRDVKLENNPTQIQKVLDLGYHCEIDVWYINGVFLLGHDFPTIAVSEYDLENSKLWCHAKTVESLQKMLTNKNINCFWHEGDQYTLTSKGYIWTLPETRVSEKCVIVDNSKNITNYGCAGVCSDYIELYNT